MNRIAAVVTAYHPDERLAAVVESALADCAAVIVVDNTPGDAPSLAEKLDDPRVRVLRSGRNLGLAGALNAGIEHLPEDAEAVLFLDQDSVLPAELVAGLLAHLESDPAIGIAAPTPWDPNHDAGYDNLAGLRADVADRTDVITSGMLVRRGALERVGGFRTEFFVDFVDIDFCLKVRRAGLRVVQDQRLRLPHTLGDRRAHRLGPLRILVVHHPAWRQYWILRGAAVLCRENLRREPAFAAKSVFFMASWFWRAAAFGDGRAAQATAALRGVLDGLVLRRVSRRYLPEGADYAG
jgi:rhamnosyltransferase